MEQTFAPYSIWTQAYEKELDKKYGIELGKLENGKSSLIEKIARKDVPIFIRDTRSRDKKFCEGIDKILKKYSYTPNYCSMMVKDSQELNKHISNFYRTMYLHYTLGKSKNLKGKFPKDCCGISSTSITLSLMRMGYPNATLFTSLTTDHNYVALPFVLKNTWEEGFIIGDPTSNQLWTKENITPPKNLIFLAKENKWEYKTDWATGKNLFPEFFSNLKTIRKYPHDNIYSSDNLKEYFEEVFMNSISLQSFLNN